MFRNGCTGTHTHDGTRMPKTVHHYVPRGGTSSLAEAYVCRSVIPRLCESPSLSHRLKRCSWIYPPFTRCNSEYCFSVCVFCCHSSSICSHHKSSVINIEVLFLFFFFWMISVRQSVVLSASKMSDIYINLLKN